MSEDDDNEVGGPEDQGLTSRIGPMEVDWPKALGYFGGIGLAVAFEVIEPPLAVFVGCIPFLKMLNRPDAPTPMRMVAQFFDGMAKPVGGDGTSVVRLTSADVLNRPVEHVAAATRGGRRVRRAAASRGPTP